MRNVGDKEGEKAIYMARFNYQRNEWAKGCFAVIGGVVGGALAVETLVPAATASGGTAVASSLLRFNRATTYWRMGINAGTQAMLSKDGWRGVNIISLLADGVAPRLSMLTPVVEWRPFKVEKDQRIRSVYNGSKSMSETFFDMGVQRATGGVSNAGSGFVKGQLKNMSVLEKRAIENLFFPMHHAPYQFLTQYGAEEIGEALDIKVKQDETE